MIWAELLRQRMVRKAPPLFRVAFKKSGTF